MPEHLKQARGQGPQPPPNYRPAAFQALRCGTCKHMGPTGRCKQFKAPVDAQYVCDAVEGRELKLPGAFKVPGAFKFGSARRLVLKVAAEAVGGGALPAGHRLSTDVHALGPAVARPGTPVNAARTVQPAGANPLVDPRSGHQEAQSFAPAAAPRHTPPAAPAQPSAQKAQLLRGQHPHALLTQLPQAPPTPTMARAPRTLPK